MFVSVCAYFSEIRVCVCVKCMRICVSVIRICMFKCECACDYDCVFQYVYICVDVYILHVAPVNLFISAFQYLIKHTHVYLLDGNY